METKDIERACKDCFVDMTSYLSSESPNMLTFFNLFKQRAVDSISTVRVNVQDDCYPVLEYNSKWIAGLYMTGGKYFLLTILYMELLKFILHHVTSRNVLSTTAEASMAIVNGREARHSLDYYPRKEREALLGLLDSRPSRAWLTARLKEEIPDSDFYLERIAYLLLENGQPSSSNDAEDSSQENGVNTDKGTVESMPSMEEYFSSKSTEENTAKWGENDSTDELLRRTFESVPASGWGNVSTEQLTGIKLANQRKVNVRGILANFRQSVMSSATTATRMKPNRRRGMEIPGLRHEYRARVLIAVDTSGSMSQEDIANAVSTFESYLTGAEVDYCFWDTDCTDPVRLSKHTGIANQSSVNVSRGGTDPSSIERRLAELDLTYDGIVLITDGYWDWTVKTVKSTIAVVDTKAETMESLPSFVKFSMLLEDLLKSSR